MRYVSPPDSILPGISRVHLGNIPFINWRFTLIAVSVAPVLFIAYTYTRPLDGIDGDRKETNAECVSKARVTNRG